MSLATVLLPFLLQAAGVGQIALALAHAAFPKRLQWPEETARMSPVNRQIFWVHTYFVVLTVLLMGVLSLFYARALLTPSPLTHPILAGYVIFWSFRLFCQFFVYKSDLWRGKRLETFVHVLFTFLWSGLTALYAVAFWATS